MGIDKVKQHLAKCGKDNEIIVLKDSTATVELAADSLGVSGAEIAKSISLYDRAGGVILIVAAGCRKIDSRKFKDRFGIKAKMLAFENVETLVGHPVGGVCPFGVNDGVRIFLDVSLKNYPLVYPACGSSHSAIKLSIAELELVSAYEEWVDVTKD